VSVCIRACGAVVNPIHLVSVCVHASIYRRPDFFRDCLRRQYQPCNSCRLSSQRNSAKSTSSLPPKAILGASTDTAHNAHGHADDQEIILTLLTNAIVSQRAACAANAGARAKINSPAFDSSEIVAVDVAGVLSLGQCNPNVRSYDSRIFLSIAHTPHYQNNALVHSSHTTRLYPKKKKSDCVCEVVSVSQHTSQ
jgi:hypothetical protein